MFSITDTETTLTTASSQCGMPSSLHLSTTVNLVVEEKQVMIQINDLQENFQFIELSPEETGAIAGGGPLGRLIGGVIGGVAGGIAGGLLGGPVGIVGGVAAGVSAGSTLGDAIEEAF